MPGKSLIGNLAVNLLMETFAFEKGATYAEKRANQMERKFRSIGQGLESLGRSMTLSLTAPILGAGVASVACSTAGGANSEAHDGGYQALILFAVTGALVFVAASDLITLFLGLEVMSLAVYVLAASRVRSPRSVEAGLKYFVTGGVAGAFQGRYLKPVYLDVRVEAGREFLAPVDPENTVFAYIMHGSAEFGSPGSGMLADRQAVLMDAGDQVRALAGNDGARFLLLSGRPLREPIAWGGPIVMNTQAELEQAFAELDNGTFIRHPG